MSMLNDVEILAISMKHGMIEPFVPMQVKEGLNG